MAVKLTQLKCPSCGANLEFKGDKEKVFCTYCGTPILLTDENLKRKEIVTRVIDEAAIEKEKRKAKEAELSNKNDRMLYIVACALMGLAALIVLAMYLFD